jgi:hypothetical protein
VGGGKIEGLCLKIMKKTCKSCAALQFNPVTKEYLRNVHGMLTSETSATKDLLNQRTKDKEQEDVEV